MGVVHVISLISTSYRFADHVYDRVSAATHEKKNDDDE